MKLLASFIYTEIIFGEELFGDYNEVNIVLFHWTLMNAVCCNDYQNM